jgi:hypothetical protein
LRSDIPALGLDVFLKFLDWRQEDASTVVKYQSYGPKHAMFFKTNGVELEKAIDPRRGWGRMECNFFRRLQ